MKSVTKHLNSEVCWSLAGIIVMLCLGCASIRAEDYPQATADGFAIPQPGQKFVFPRDYGSHPEYAIEWWYITGWLTTPDQKPLGFQITFFRSSTTHDADNPSRFAPKQLIIAHAALSDPELGKLQHASFQSRK